MSSKKLKASDRQAVAGKVTLVLKRKYGGSVPKHGRSVLETLIFAALLENATVPQAEAAFQALMEGFHDFNEIRVSSVAEIEQVLASKVADADWRALRIKDVLQYVFEKYYAFDFEDLKRKTQDLATKQLTGLSHLSPFMELYVLQNSLGCHVVPLDSLSRDVLAWLGLVPSAASINEAADEMKSALRKADAPQFCYLLRCLATDPAFKRAFKLKAADLDEGRATLERSDRRLSALLAGGGKASPVSKSLKKPARAAAPQKKAKAGGGKVVTKKVTKPKRAAGKSPKRAAKSH